MATKQTKEYTGTCYIGVTGPEFENGECRDSIERIVLRPGDQGPDFIRATKGYEARQEHLNNFINGKHAFCLFLDSDMAFQSDTLERLRTHKLPYVSGFYMRRMGDPVAPVWYRPYAGQWPFENWIGPVERNRLHKIGASGWGCMLVHRDAIMAVRNLLKGEWEIIEDDMDVWPYDLGAIMNAIAGLKELLAERPGIKTLYPALAQHVKMLENEIRPLRADREIVGSDIRFPFFALQAGYQLMGDPEVRPGHIIHYPLSPDDYDGIAQGRSQDLEKARRTMHKRWLDDSKRLKKQIEGLT